MCAWPQQKSKPRDRLVRWRVSLIKKTPAKFIDFAYAPDAQSAERKVAKEHNISGTLRNRPLRFARIGGRRGRAARRRGRPHTNQKLMASAAASRTSAVNR